MLTAMRGLSSTFDLSAEKMRWQSLGARITWLAMAYFALKTALELLTRDRTRVMAENLPSSRRPPTERLKKEAPVVQVRGRGLPR